LDWKTKAELHLFYRTRQVHHSALQEILRSRIPFIILGAVFLIIMPLFCLIRLHSVFNPLMLTITTCICGFGLLFLKLVTTFAALLSSCSAGYAQCRWPFGDERFGAMDRLTFKSYFPLRLRAGNIFKFGKLTFPILMQEVVVTVLVNGLVILRNYPRS